ncbi:MAG: T9SS type A sorting domain-containing protein [Saprospiraceae bacterium]
MKNILVISFSLLSFCMKSQTYFNKQYIHGSPNWLSSLGDVVQNKDSSYLGLAWTIDGANNDIQNLRLLKIDKYGKTEWTKDYSFENMEPGRILPTSDGNFVINGLKRTRTNGLFTLNTFLFKIDSKGDSLWIQHYEHNAEWTIAGSLVSTADKGFICAGSLIEWIKVGNEYKEQPSQAYFIKTDSLGNLLWKRSYGDSKYSLTVMSTVELPNKDILAVGRYQSFRTKDFNDLGMMAMRLGANGDAQWWKTYGREDANESFVKITKTSNNQYLVSGTFGVDNTNEYNGGVLGKLDENGEVIWMKGYNDKIKGFAFSGGHTQLANGDITVAGISYLTDDVGIAQFDSTGNLKWFRRNDLNPNSYESIYGIIPTSDKGFAIFGDGLSTISGNDQAWLLKLDQYGCDSEACAKSVATADSPENKVMQLIVYPNPSNGDARVRWSLDEVLSHAVLSISDARGVPIHALPISTASGEFELEGLNLANGMYVATISSRGKIECKKIIVLK